MILFLAFILLFLWLAPQWLLVVGVVGMCVVMALLLFADVGVKQ